MGSAARRALTAAMATCVLALATTVGSSASIEVTGQRFRAVYSSLSFKSPLVERPVQCAVTLEGSFHTASITITRGALVGNVARASLGSCTGGSATVLSATLPWHLNYDSLTGTPPAITAVNLNLTGGAFRIQPSGSIFACLTRSTAERPVKFAAQREAEAGITSLVTDPAATIPLPECFSEGSLEGSGSITSRNEEESPPSEAFVGLDVYYEHIGTRLVERSARRLADVTIATAGEQRTLEMLNASNDYRAVLNSVALDRTENFRLENVDIGRCEGRLSILSPARGGNPCAIRIRRLEGTPNTVTARVVINYRIGTSFPSQSFVVRGS